jgi:hypothetical protein
MKTLLQHPFKALNNRLLIPWTNLFKKDEGVERPILDTHSVMTKLVEAKDPMVYGKIGTTELMALEHSDRFFSLPWPSAMSFRRAARRLYIDSGVFPETRDQFDEFLRIYRASIAELDCICLWQDTAFLQAYERAVATQLCPHAGVIEPSSLSPLCILPHISHLRWLVVSPFVQTMRLQATRLRQIFGRFPWAEQIPEIGPRCEFVRCPFFPYMESSPYKNWSEGLDQLAEEILAKDFDLAIVGAGAWSLPLLARVKRSGKKGIHLGGGTQLLFGIKGRRWDDYCSAYYNDSWVRPLPEDTPQGCMQKERGCYW